MITLDQNEIIKHNIKDFFKFIKMENSSYCELIKKREECRSKYNSELFKLNVKKEKLWSQMDYSKWKMNETEEKIDRQLLSKDKILSFKKMCYKETAQLNNLHNHLGYLNTMNLIELRRLILSHCGKYMKNIKDFTESFYPTLTQV